MLAVPAQIDAHDAALLELPDKASHAVGVTFSVDPAGPGTASLGKDQDVLPEAENVITLIQRLSHLLTAPAPVDGNALGQITEHRQDRIPLKVIPLRKVPGNAPEVRQVTEKRKHCICQDHGIHHGQVIRAYDPRSPVLPECLIAGLPEVLEVPDPIAHHPDKEKVGRAEDKDADASQENLNLHECFHRKGHELLNRVF